MLRLNPSSRPQAKLSVDRLRASSKPVYKASATMLFDLCLANTSRVFKIKI